MACNRDCGGVSKPIRCTDDEGIEGVLRVESVAFVIVDSGGGPSRGFSDSDGDLGDELGRWNLFFLVLMVRSTKSQFQIGIDGDG